MSYLTHLRAVPARRQLLAILAVLLIGAQLQHAQGSMHYWSRLRDATMGRIQRTFQPLALLAQQAAADNTLDAEQQKQQLVPPSGPSAVLQTYPSLMNGEALHDLEMSVHGHVNKSGIAERLHWSLEPKYAVAREAVFKNWRQQEQQSPLPALQPGQPVTCAAARHTPVPHHHCHVFVNHKYRIAYIRSPKSSSTSIMNWLGQCHYNKTRNWNATTCMEYSW
jgi:hypothetical protein